MDNLVVRTHLESEENVQANQQLLPATSTDLQRTSSHHTQLAQYDGTASLSRSPSTIAQLANRDERRPSRGLFYEYVCCFILIGGQLQRHFSVFLYPDFLPFTMRFNYPTIMQSIAFFFAPRLAHSTAHRFIQGKLSLNTKRMSRDEIIDEDGFVRLKLDRELECRAKNRQLSDNAITSALSAFYAKVIVVLGIAFPVTDVLAVKAPNSFYQGFYLFLYLGSIAFVLFMYVDHLRTKRIYATSKKSGENRNKCAEM